MSSFSAEAKVGFFVILGISLLAYMSFKIGKLGFDGNPGYKIDACFNSASGLAIDVPVEIAGVEVGRVRKIALKNGKALVTLWIKHEVKLSNDAQAFIKTKGILGDKYVELSTGTSGAPLIKEGEQLVSSGPVADVDELMAILGEIAKDIKQVTNTFATVIGGKDGQASLQAIITNLEEMLITTNNVVRENNKDISKIVDNFSDFSEILKTIGDNNKGSISKTIEHIRTASKQLEYLIANFSEISKKINSGKGSLGKLVNDGETINNLNKALASLKNITDKINQGKGSIGKLVNDETTVKKIDSALSGINSYLQKQDTYRTYIDYRGEYLFEPQETKSYLSLRIQPKEDKYYLLQIVDDPQGKDTITDTVTTIDSGVPTTEHKVETNREGLKFSAQIAKRYYDLGLRGGIFESTGGVGIDYHFFDDHLKLSFEAFDFDPDTAPHCKFKAEFSPYKHLYISSGFDDFLSDQNNESFFIGAGISFADEDIKTILSTIPIPK